MSSPSDYRDEERVIGTQARALTKSLALRKSRDH